MYVVGHVSEVIPTKDTPRRQEDPFSVLAHQQLANLLPVVWGRFGEDVRLAITFANCFGGWTFCDPQAKALSDLGPKAVSAYLSVAWFPAAAQGQVTIRHHLRVPALTFSTKFFAFQDALTTGLHWLRAGSCDVLLAGAAETVGSAFLSQALGPGAANDAITWMALIDHGEPGDTRLRMPDTPPPTYCDVELTEQSFRGSPMDGACALPLLLLSALRSDVKPWVLRVPDRAVIRANQDSVELWRLR